MNAARNRSRFARPQLVIDVDEWRDDAACIGVDTEVFYVHPSETDRIARAVAYCDRCPVTQPCLADALATGDRYAVRGGTTPWQRRGLRRLEVAA